MSSRLKDGIESSHDRMTVGPIRWKKDEAKECLGIPWNGAGRAMNQE